MILLKNNQNIIKKILFVLLFSLCLIVNIVINNNVVATNQNEFIVPKEFDTSKIYNISFWSKNDNNKTQQAVYKAAIKSFESLYPNIHVEIKEYSDYLEIYKDVITNISTNTTPNICITYPDHIATYKEGSNTVISLDNLMNDENYGFGGNKLLFDGPTSDEIVKKFLDEEIIDGKYYALPFMRSSEALYINKTYLDEHNIEIPKIITWDWIFEQSDYIKSITPSDETMIPFIYKSTDNMMIQMLKQLGGDNYCTSNGDVYLFNNQTKNILKEISSHAYTKVFSTFGISSYPGNYFNKGECIFAVDSTAGSTWLGSNCPLLDIDRSEVVDFETIVKPIPQYDGDHPQMISQGPSICIFNKEDNNEVLASWLFAQYLLTNDTQIKYSRTEGYVPVTHKALESSDYLNYLAKSGTDNDTYYSVKIDCSKLVIDNIENTFITPVFNGSTLVRKASGQLIEEACRAARTKKRTLEDKELEDIFKKVNDLYAIEPTIGKMPKGSIILLVTLGACWLGIGTYYVLKIIKKQKQKIH